LFVRLWQANNTNDEHVFGQSFGETNPSGSVRALTYVRPTPLASGILIDNQCTNHIVWVVIWVELCYNCVKFSSPVIWSRIGEVISVGGCYSTGNQGSAKNLGFAPG